MQSDTTECATRAAAPFHAPDAPPYTRCEPSHRLVIGYGNDLRGDDGAGRAAADALAECHLTGVSVLSVHQLTPELAPLLADAGMVVFLDASASSDAAVSLAHLSPAATGGPPGHFATPERLLLLTQEVYGRTPRSCLITIPAEQFTPGAPFSARARTGIARAVEMARQLLAIASNTSTSASF